jgi:hypothetical protein
MKKTINRREFFKATGLAALAIGGFNARGKSNDTPTPEGITYRTNSSSGDKVSILGYGCMRWPMAKDENNKDIIDQEATNALVDYAIANGVNYFDTSPVYIKD